MSSALQFVIYLAAFLCFLLAAFGARASWAGRLNLIGLGLALWIFVPLVQTLQRIT
jgi:energy-coupling factor transporter transmembrane protein EcfT